VEEPGCVTLTPEQALNFTRSRYFQKFEDGDWVSDPLSDLGRIQRQQAFLRAALDRAISKGVRNPFTLNELVTVAKNSVTLDDSFKGKQIVDLGVEFRDFNPDSLEMFSPPVTRAMKGGADVLLLEDAEAQPILDRFRGVSPEDDIRASTSVEVRNGTGVSGQGSATLTALKDHGFFTVRSVDSNNFAGETTVVLYQPGQEAKAVEVARYVDGPLRFQEDTGLTDVTVAVVTGEGFVGIRTEPADPASLEAKLPTTTTLPDTPTTEPDAPTTTTTVANQFVPTTPEGVSCG
jgi:polyisoprenyl-teichoic acid--peptidoglycan teichoic acid transferase